MKPRHSAALAFVGWYFLSPPVYAPGGRIYDTAPLSAWSLIKSLDTAAECEAFKARGSADVNTTPYVPDSRRQITAERLEKSICIASDDPRLKEK
jgi:hypothetical protein